MQPYVALGVGLRKRGHEVCIATHADFENFVRKHGLAFYPLAASGQNLQANAIGDRMLHAGSNPFVFLREFTHQRKPIVKQLLHSCWLACRRSDLILSTSTEFLLAEAVAEREKIPVVWASIVPSAPSRYQVSCLFPQCPEWMPVKSIYNLLTHAATALFMWMPLSSAMSRARLQVLGLPPMPIYKTLASYIAPRLSVDGYSPQVVPRPRDWGANQHVTGYWFLEPEADWKPPADLVHFLATGRPPICVGFGSMHNRDAHQVTRMVVQALQATKQRGVLLSGWNGLTPMPNTEQLYFTQAIPHSWLFPQTAGVVHHGGAGSTAAGLRAGVPSLVIPYMADQPFWGQHVHALGVGPRPIPRIQLTAKRLAESFQQMVTDQEMIRRASYLGSRIRAEDGITRAVEHLESYYRQHHGEKQIR